MDLTRKVAKDKVLSILSDSWPEISEKKSLLGQHPVTNMGPTPAFVDPLEDEVPFLGRKASQPRIKVGSPIQLPFAEYVPSGSPSRSMYQAALCWIFLVSARFSGRIPLLRNRMNGLIHVSPKSTGQVVSSMYPSSSSTSTRTVLLRSENDVEATWDRVSARLFCNRGIFWILKDSKYAVSW